MTDPSTLRSWLTFFGCVLVVGILYWAQAVLMPVAIALLVTFMLTTPVAWLQQRVGRVPAVLVVVVLAFTAIGAAGWGMWHQAASLAAELPGYRANIRQKIGDVRRAGRGGSVEKFQDTITDIQAEIAKSDAPRGPDRRPIVTQAHPVTSLWGFPSWLGPLVDPLSTAGLIIVLVIFMLLEREDLRDRLIRLVGHGHLTVTTKAFDEAGRRVSRQLLMQLLVNVLFGAAVGGGLHWIGVPYATLWGVAAVPLRFVPYLGPLVAAGAPILMSLASADGWAQPLLVAGLFVALEVFTNLVLETVLYAGAAGVSQVALLISVAFWTWLWGLPGLLMAMPLTVCLVVLGKHVRGLEFIATLLAEKSPPSPEVGYYHRLLAHDQGEAADLIDRHVKTEAADTVYDALLLPALNYAERDRLEHRLSREEEDALIAATRDLVTDAAAALPAAPANVAGGIVSPPRAIGIGANGAADDLALGMLGQLLASAGVAFDVLPGPLMASDIVAAVRESGSGVVCIADLPPSPPSRTRYLVKKLRATLPELHILVGRWAPPALVDEDHGALSDAGASHVASTMLQTRDRLVELAATRDEPD